MSSTALGSIRPSIELVDAHLVLRDLVGGPRMSAIRHRAGGNRLDHVLEAFLDALGDLDFAFAGEELDGAHLAHVHAHRVGGAAELGVDGRTGSARLRLLGLLVVDDGGATSDISRSSAAGATSNTWMPMSLKVLMMDSICSASTRSSGRWSLISA